MSTIARQFIEFCVSEGVLQFGQFELRSGRCSPYFFNFGAFSNGKSLARLGQYYADKIVHDGINFDMLFGPAYKGIPIATATAASLYRDHGRSVGVGFNRKEAKQHAEKGAIMGQAPQGRVLLIDDVLTSGMAADEVIGLLAGFPGAEVAGLLVGLDRQEQSALRERLNVHAVAQLGDAVQFVRHSPEYSQYLDSMQEYYRQYAQ